MTETRCWLAELAVFGGDAAAGLLLANDLAGSVAGTPFEALLDRVRGLASEMLGRPEEAVAFYQASLAAARFVAARHEEALTLFAMGDAAAEPALDALGIVAVPNPLSPPITRREFESA